MPKATCKGCEGKVIWGAAGGRMMAVDATPAQNGPYEVFHFKGGVRIRPHQGSVNQEHYKRHNCERTR